MRLMCEHQFTHLESWHATATGSGTVTVEVTLYLLAQSKRLNPAYKRRHRSDLDAYVLLLGPGCEYGCTHTLTRHYINTGVDTSRGLPTS